MLLFHGAIWLSRAANFDIVCLHTCVGSRHLPCSILATVMQAYSYSPQSQAVLSCGMLSFGYLTLSRECSLISAFEAPQRVTTPTNGIGVLQQNVQQLPANEFLKRMWSFCRHLASLNKNAACCPPIEPPSGVRPILAFVSGTCISSAGSCQHTSRTLPNLSLHQFHKQSKCNMLNARHLNY